MNKPCAQARRVKDIGLVLPKYYGKNGNTGRGRDSSYVTAVAKGGFIYGNNIFDSRKSERSPVKCSIIEIDT